MFKQSLLIWNILPYGNKYTYTLSISRHVKKFKLKTQDNEISSLVIYLMHNITLINTLRLN